MLSLDSIARALGGEVRKGQVRAPGPGHSASDRSLSVRLTKDGQDIVVNSFADDDWVACRDYVRQRAGLPEWKPTATTAETIVERMSARARRARQASTASTQATEEAPAMERAEDYASFNDAEPAEMPVDVQPEVESIVMPIPADRPAPNFRSSKHGEPTAVYTYRDAEGHDLGYVARYDTADGKIFLPTTLWQTATGLVWRKKAWLTPRPLYGLDKLAARPNASVIVCEGEKAADAAEIIFPSSVAVTSPNGSKAARSADWRPLAGRQVTIWPDNDAAGLDYARTVRAELATVGAGVVTVVEAAKVASVLPSGEARTPPEGWDAADARADDWDLQALAALVLQSSRRSARSGAPKKDRAERRASADPSAGPPEKDGRPIVWFVAGKVPEAVDRMETLLLQAGVEIYARAGTLVRPVIEEVPAAKGRMTTVARMSPLMAVSLADMVARIMRVQRFDGRAEDWLDINPPAEMTLTLLAREGQWRVPPVAGIITTPTLRPDGSLLTVAGYDPATRLYLAHDPGFTMPDLMERPDHDEAVSALAFIEALLVSFPFVGAVDRAVALSGILTALVRGVLPTAPLHAIRAHSPGSGKSFFVDLAAVIATGRRCPVIAAGKTEEETEKRLGALLRDAVPVVSIDNVNGELGGDMLCQLTERPLVRVRILGKSEAPELECRSTTFATGNNLVLTGDMTRRAVICSLDAEMDRPELRDFSFNPIDRVMADRGAYVAAALTVIRAYQVAGSPKVCGSLGSYEDWSDMVRSPLVWLGHADPVTSMETAREEDPELSAIRELFEHWREHLQLSCGYTTNAITKTACEKGPGSSFDYNTQEFKAPEFRDLLLRQAGDGGAVNSRRLGKWLSRIKGRVVGGYRIEMREDSSHGNRFSLCRVGAPGDSRASRPAPEYRAFAEPVF